jgi:DNA-directed RNA polymerase specialized sigma subunit
VIRLRFLQDLEMREIGRRMGFNESRASQVVKVALKRMRESLV